MKTSKKHEYAQESLSRAVNGLSTANYNAIFNGFMEKGIAGDDIKPRENVFTYAAWIACGRQVRKGEHGVKVHTWIPVQGKQKADGTRGPDGKICRTSTVFHVSQTDPVAELVAA